ncbi:MAG: DNA polymerase III subunit delta [Dehalococcoidales bacterium]
MYVLTGRDDFSLKESLEEIKKGIGEESLLEANTSELDGQQVKPEQIRNLVEAAPFLAVKRLVIIRGLLVRFVQKDKSGRKKGEGSKTSAGKQEYGPFLECMKNVPDSTVLVMVDSLDYRDIKASSFFNALSNMAEVQFFPLLNKPGLRNWVNQRVKREGGGGITGPAVELLVELIGSNLWMMRNEIIKLVLYTAGSRIDKGDVGKVVSYSREIIVFEMVDAVIDSNAKKAEKLIERLLQRGAPPVQLLFMLSRQFRYIARVKSLKNMGEREPAVKARLGISSDFVFRKTLEQASRYSLERIRGVYQRLLETDLAIKTGKMRGEVALEVLVAELCR